MFLVLVSKNGIEAKYSVDTSASLYQTNENTATRDAWCEERIKHVEKDRDFCFKEIEVILTKSCSKKDLDKQTLINSQLKVFNERLKQELESAKKDLEEKEKEHKEFVKKMNEYKKIFEEMLKRDNQLTK